MKRSQLNTVLWMVVFAAATFAIIPLTFLVFVFAGPWLGDSTFEYVLWPLRLIFIASPFIAWWLGRRGALPGTKSSVDATPSPNHVTKFLLLGVMVILGLLNIGAWVAFLPQPSRPHISITFLGYTNDAAGNALAKIAVTNCNPTTIFVYAPRIELISTNDSRDYEDYFSGTNCSWQATLATGDSGSFTIPPPTNQLPWRLAFYVYPDRGRTIKNTLKGVVGISCLSVGLWPLFEKYLCFVETI